jgi:hypothetical protein
MSESKKFSLGGFPPIFEIVSTIKSKEFKPNTILSIQAILSKRNFNRSNETNNLQNNLVNNIVNKIRN